VIQIIEHLCHACGACVDACPRQAIRIANGVAVVDEASCDGCGRCVPVCPNEAILRVDVMTPETAGGAVMVREAQPSVVSLRPVVRSAAIWPVLGSALLWAGREVLPRVADLALDVLARRGGGAAVSRRGTPAVGAGRRGHRQRQRQRRKGNH
jgi:ferredoxin